MNYVTLPICDQKDCLFRDIVYCTHDAHLITPNSKECKFLMKGQTDANESRNEVQCEGASFCKGIGCCFE